MSIERAVSHEVHERVRVVLQRLFPGHGAPASDEAVDGFVHALWQLHGPRLEALGFPELAMDRATIAPPAAPTHPFYVAHAVHHRVLDAASANGFESRFTGDLPVVRVPLPERLDDSSCPLLTAIGAVDFAHDHLAGSVAAIAERYAADLGYAPARVDLVTPARLGDARFGAIALYLGYRDAADACPSFYVLEAGTAPGVPEQLYLGAGMDTVIVTPSGYKPTPFSSADNTYRGWLTLDGDEPTQLVVQASTGDRPFYVEVTVSYEKVATPPLVWPALLVLDAASRVAALAEAMRVPSGEPVETVLAAAGRELSWDVWPPSRPR